MVLANATWRSTSMAIDMNETKHQQMADRIIEDHEAGIDTEEKYGVTVERTCIGWELNNFPPRQEVYDAYR